MINYIKEENSLNQFLIDYRNEFFPLFSRYFKIPHILNRFTTFIFISRLVPISFINLFLNIYLKNKKTFKILIYSHQFCDIYFRALTLKKAEIKKIDKFFLLILKISCYKFANPGIKVSQLTILLRKLILLFESSGYYLIIPHDYYPETYFLVKLFKKFISMPKSICVQHGINKNFFKDIDKNYVLSGMNSDLFFAWDKNSQQCLKKLVEKNNKDIIRNQSLLTLNLNLNPYLIDYFEKNSFSKNIYDFSRRNNFSQNNYLIIFIQANHPDNYLSIKYDDIYLKIIDYLSKEKLIDKNHSNIFYKPRNPNKLPKSRIREINIIKSKEKLFNMAFKALVFTGESTLAYEMKYFGSYNVGINDERNQDLPLSIYDQSLSPKDNLEDEIKKVLSLYSEYKSTKVNRKKIINLNEFGDILLKSLKKL